MPANVNEPDFVKAISQDVIYKSRDAGWTITDAAAMLQSKLDPLIYSNLSVNDGPLEWITTVPEGEEPYQARRMRRLTWKEAFEKERERADRMQSFETFVRDLDRCQHGRHEGDVCSSERGCGGPSKGNIWMQDIEERRLTNGEDDERPAHFGLGHSLYGDSYFLRRPPTPGALPVAIKRRYRDGDAPVRVETIELGER